MVDIFRPDENLAPEMRYHHFMLSTLTRAARLSALVFVLVLPGAVFGCSSNGSSSASNPPAKVDTEGQAFARGVLGTAPQGTLPADATIEAQRYDAFIGHVLTAIEAKYPGGLDQRLAELQTGKVDAMIAAHSWMDGAVAELSDSAQVRDALGRDPLFSGVNIQAHSGLSPLNTGGSGSGSGSTPNVGKGADGKYGDGRTGMSGAMKDLGDLTTDAGSRGDTKKMVDDGKLTPDPDSRLGAYAATKGYPAGTVGNAVHNAIGTIYGTLGNYGEEKIGRVFNSPEAKALYNEPVGSDAGRQMAAIEQQYWANVKTEDPSSPGGNLGAAFSPGVRDWLQRHIF